ncbi:MAG: transposase, partial [Thermoplasmata archaeon]
IRLLPGSASSAQNLIEAIEESEIKNAIVIGDKGFYSAENLAKLEAHQSHIHYIVPLPRDLPFLQYPSQNQYKEHFLYKESVQWWREYTWNGRRIIQYLDKQIGAEEELALLRKVHEGRLTKQDYQRNRNRLGTLALITDLGDSPMKVYELYKQRREIEQIFESLKNTLEADKTWMQSREKLQGYLFILFLALHLYTQILDHLRRKELLEEYSVHDVLWELSKVYVVTVGEQNLLNEVPKSTRKLLNELEIHITQKLGS